MWECESSICTVNGIFKVIPRWCECINVLEYCVENQRQINAVQQINYI